MSVETIVQGGLYTALNAIGLTAYDHAPQAADAGAIASWPYVEVGAIILTDWDTNTELGFGFLARVHTRSRSGSAAEAKGIQGQIYGALHRHEMMLAGFNNVMLIRDMTECTRVADASFHGVCEYRGLIRTN